MQGRWYKYSLTTCIKLFSKQSSDDNFLHTEYSVVSFERYCYSFDQACLLIGVVDQVGDVF